MALFKKIISFVLVFIIGGLGGIVGERILFPYLASKPLFSKFRFVRAYGTTIINEEKKIIIRENEVLEDAIEKVSNQVVVVDAVGSLGHSIESASGFLLTGDGIVATTNAVLPAGLSYQVRIDGDNVPASVLIRDSGKGIALLKVERSNLSVVTFSPGDSPALGETVFLVAKVVEGERIGRFVNVGVVRSEGDENISSIMSEERRDTDGSPLFDIEGRVVGINIFNAKGEFTTVSLKNLKSLIDLGRSQ